MHTMTSYPTLPTKHPLTTHNPKKANAAFVLPSYFKPIVLSELQTQYPLPIF
jgi:hypothetical protein